MKLITKVSAFLVAGLSFIVTPANAATFYINAAAGHPFLTAGVANWDSTWTLGFLRIADGRSIYAVSTSITITRTWVIHIPVTSTSVNWNSVARGTGGGISQRICAFDAGGSFSGCGGSQTFGVASTVPLLI